MRKPLSLLALGFPLLAAAAAAAAGDAPVHPLPPEPEHTGAITPQEFLWEAAWLSDDARSGRDTASPGGREAAAWIAGRMKAMGLEETEGAPGYLRPWDFGSEPVKAECVLELSREGEKPRTFALGEDWVALGGSAPLPLDAPVVFAGYGIRAQALGYDDFAGLDCKGKVVVAFRHEPRERDPKSRWDGDRASRYSWFFAKVDTARAAGAAAVVFVNDPLNHATDPLDVQSVGGRGEPPIPVLMARRAFAAEVLRGTGYTPECLQEAIDMGDAPVPVRTEAPRVRLKVVRKTITADNVCGVLRGTDPKLRDEWVVVGAHYDHVGLGQGGGLNPRLWGQIHNGADDNASGTAAMLEIAESFALGKERPRRSLLFLAFSGEEKGLLGSMAFVRKPLFPLARVVAMVNLDMVGRYRPGQLDIVAAETGSTLKETVDRASEGLGLEYRHTNEGLASSDGLSFFMAKVPTVFFFTGLHDDYHRPSDDWWLLNAEGAAKVAEWAARTVRTLADADGRPEFHPVRVQAVGMGSRVVLGVVPSDAPDGKGAVLDEVSQRSPAVAAGMQAGDRIVSFGGREVRTADELRAALDHVRPGDTAVAKVVRGTESMDMTVTFPAPPGPVFGVSFDQGEDGKKGALIQEVAPGSVAEAAGVKPGDRILAFGGKEIPDGGSLPGALRAAKPGDHLKVKVDRDGKEVDLEAAYPEAARK
jgi:Zn-dependent M28 family amino/carboxypeptidase